MTKATNSDAAQAQARQYLLKPYARRFVPDEEGGFVGSIHEFPGCIAEGDTIEEAACRLEDAAESWLTSQLHHAQAVREPVSFTGFSGKIALRIPRGLHKQASELAELEGTSLNQLLVSAIAVYVGGICAAHSLAHEVAERAKSFAPNIVTVYLPERREDRGTHRTEGAMTLPGLRTISTSISVTSYGVATDGNH